MNSELPSRRVTNRDIDAVIMLTWSDWHSEPRSNRYHYATRFAKQHPVYFVQPDSKDGRITFEALENSNITLVHVPAQYDAEAAEDICDAFYKRGVRAPLTWVYNVYFEQVLARLASVLTVYHATEDYIAKADKVAITQTDISRLAIAAVQRADFVVAVSEGVAKTHRPVSSGPVLVLPNGCDFDFWSRTGASDYVAPAEGRVALFQGGINGRLDFALLERLSELLPHWQFWFCGKAVDGGADWERLQKRPNVVYRGFLDSDGIAALAKQALVGLIPFKDSDLMRRSLPLKAYEYLACGLPVVTTPVDALAGQDELFRVATDAEEFAQEVVAAAASRTDPAALATRRRAAQAMSYDQRFEELQAALHTGVMRRLDSCPRLNALMLYDDRSTHVGTIMEHLQAFQKYSRHNFHFLPATGDLSALVENGRFVDLRPYDAIFIHYSVRLSLDYHLAPQLAEALERYRGPKMMFIQDEYDTTETTRTWIERLDIGTLFTNVPEESRNTVYPAKRFPHLSMLPTLTGYVPEDPQIGSFVTPIEQRTVMIGYRGRRLPHHYGALGYEKFRIGVEMKHIAEERGLPVDIEVDDSRRIYGADWYRFIGSARATLGTESGANVFDFDGGLAKLAGEHRDMPFPEFAERYLGPHEGLVRMNQISPKIFEAIRLRTALILFEGEYSGVVQPDRHFIPLKKDFSNIDSVLQKLADLDYIRELTERAYREIVGSGRYSYATFVQGIDRYLEHRAFGRRRSTIVSVPLMAIDPLGDAVQLWSDLGPRALLNDAILARSPSREQIAESASARIAELRERWLAELEEKRLEAERLAALEAERLAALEAERLAALEAERLAALEAERLSALEAARLAATEAARLAALEAKRLTATKAERRAATEAARLAALEVERLAALDATQLDADKLVPQHASNVTLPPSMPRPSFKYRMVRRLWRAMPSGMRHKIALRIRNIVS